MTEEIPEQRKKLWAALSELYLDTDLRKEDYKRIAAVVINSGYNLAEVRNLLFNEVHPVLRRNLLSVAGEWAGFDDNWLIQMCSKHYNKNQNFQRTLKVRLLLSPSFWIVRTSFLKLNAEVKSLEKIS